MKHIPTEIFDQVAEELRRGEVRAGLMARAFSECAGDELKTRARYINLRAQDLHESAEALAREEREEARNAARKEAQLNLAAQREAEMRQQENQLASDREEVAKRSPSIGRVEFFIWLVLFVGFYSMASHSVTYSEAGWIGWWVVAYVVGVGSIGWLRARNIGCSGWWVFWFLIPIVAVVPFLYFLFAEPNQAARSQL